jgi:hypothetical protein
LPVFQQVSLWVPTTNVEMSKKKALYITEALAVALTNVFDHSKLENVAIVCERSVPISSSLQQVWWVC